MELELCLESEELVCCGGRVGPTMTLALDADEVEQKAEISTEIGG